MSKLNCFVGGVLTAALMLSSTPAYATTSQSQDNNFNYSNLENYQPNPNAPSVFVTSDGVFVDGKFYSKEEFTNRLQEAIDDNTAGYSSRVAVAAPLAGVYLVPGIGEVAITVTGVIVVAGSVIAVGSWLYNTITTLLSNAHENEVDSARARIPRSLLRGDNLDMSKFRSKNKCGDLIGPSNWWLSRNTCQTPHKGDKWKLFHRENGVARRIASVTESGEIVGK